MKKKIRSLSILSFATHNLFTSTNLPKLNIFTESRNDGKTRGIGNVTQSSVKTFGQAEKCKKYIVKRIMITETIETMRENMKKSEIQLKSN